MPISVRLAPIVLPLLALLLLPAQSGAQLGGLIKKAADKATERRMDKTQMVKPDPKLGTEFNAQTLDRVLGALETTAASRTKSDSLGRILEPLEKQLVDLRKANGGELEAYDAKKGLWEACRANAGNEFQQANAGQNQAAADKLAQKFQSDPAAAQRLHASMAVMQQQVNAAIASGDTASARRIGEDWMKKNGLESGLGIPETKLVAKCGNAIAPPKSLAARDALQSRINVFRTQQRQEAAAAAEEARLASGLSANEFYPMNERIERWYAIAVEGKKGERFWSDEEGELFEARRARISKVFRKLRA